MQDESKEAEIVDEIIQNEPLAAIPDEEISEELEEETEEVEEEVKEEVEEALEETTEETPEQEEVQEEVAKEDPAPPSRRETLRINQLLKKYGHPEERPAPSKSDDEDILDNIEAEPEVIERLRKDRDTTSSNQYNEGLKRAEYLSWETSLKIDAPNIEKKYPILDPKSDQFHPAVADALNTWYLRMSGHDPQSQTVSNRYIGYADFVESNMELVEEIAGQKNAQTVKNVTKQAAATGLRPDGSSAKRMNLNKAPSDMNLEELYASIGQKPPK